jgi:hypothetical protein
VEKDVNVAPRSFSKQFRLGEGAIRSQIAEDIIITTRSNGETIEPPTGDETAALEEEAFGKRGSVPPTTSLSSRPR